MPDKTPVVLLVTDDAALAELVGRTKPGDVRLERVAASEIAAQLPVCVDEGWIDLDHVKAAMARQIECGRRIYFRSDAGRATGGLPSGLFIQKPCTGIVAQLLWAGVHSRRNEQGGEERAVRPELPGWIVELQEIRLRELCRRLATEVSRRLGFADVSLYLYDDRSELLTLAESTHERAIDLSVAVQRTGESPGGGARLMVEAARRMSPIVGLDGEKRSDDRDRYEDGEFAVLPLTCDGALTGVLNLSRRLPNAGEIVTMPLDAICEFAGKALRNAIMMDRAYTEARVDALTGLANLRAFRESLESETARSRRFTTPLSLIAMDLDQMKLVNDRFGHSAGDAVLRATAQRIGAAIRQFDIPARVGGDEFAVILPGTDLSGGRTVALRILEAMRRDPARFREVPLAMTASIGLVQFENGWTLEELTAAADDVMYAAKRQGGDRVTCRATSMAPKSKDVVLNATGEATEAAAEGG